MTALYLSSLLLILISAQQDQYCWPESERITLTFHNNNTNVIDHLPTIRFIQGYWASQWALQYVGYVYLKEKMGVNVQFVPEISSGLGFADLNGTYPFTYWDQIESDNYDLLLEMWPQHGVNHYYDRGHVLFGGINEIYGEIGFFIPIYVYDEIPEAVVLSQLKHNQVLRQKFIDGYTINSNRDWVKYWNDTLYNDSDKLESYLSFGYELPSYDKPIIWGSAFTYVMSQYSHNVTKWIQIFNDSQPGLDWIFIPLGSETLLSEFVSDLYDNKQPFIANIYSPHTDFSTTSELTSDYMRFEQIAIHRNTDNSRSAQCYSQEYQCKEPITPLFKLGNSRLYDTFPEIVAFLFDFSVLAEHLNDVIAFHRESGDWFNASCKWLLQNEELISEWHQDIIRYDCSEYNECGFSNDIDKNIGGYCANSSTESLCICTDDALTGIDCRTSCPGLIGPIYNSSNSSYFFKQCSDNGKCNDRWSCECNQGFGGDGCQIVYQPFDFYQNKGHSSSAIFVIWMLSLIVLSLLMIGSIIWMWLNQKYKSVQILAPKMTTLYSIGLILLCIGTIFYLIQPKDLDNYLIVCNFRMYCYGIGAVLAIMGPLLKAYRVNVIFNQAKKMDKNRKIKIPDKKLLISLVNVVIIEIIVCIIYSIINDKVGIIYNDLYYRVEFDCNGTFNSQLLISANFMYIFFLLLTLTFFSFKNRGIKSFVESKCSFYASFSCMFLFIVTIIFHAVTTDTFILINIQCASIVIGISAILCLFYGKQIYYFYKYPTKRSEFSMTSQFIHTKTNKTKTKLNGKNANKEKHVQFDIDDNQSPDTDNDDDDDDKTVPNRDIADDLSEQRRNSNDRETTPKAIIYNSDNIEYPENEKTIKYTEKDSALYVKHGKSISLTPTATVLPFNITTGSKPKKFKQNTSMLEKVLDETDTPNKDGTASPNPNDNQEAVITYADDQQP